MKLKISLVLSRRNRIAYSVLAQRGIATFGPLLIGNRSIDGRWMSLYRMSQPAMGESTVYVRGDNPRCDRIVQRAMVAEGPAPAINRAAALIRAFGGEVVIKDET
jgi:hypothetical protein